MASRFSTRHVAVHVQGVVQGVGFRPFVFRIATARGLAGWVRNGADGVRLEVRGPGEAVAEFLAELQDRPPPQARIRNCDVREVADEQGPRGGGPGPRPPGDFEILESEDSDQPHPCVPADLAVCGECAAEIDTPGERRYRYPFTNCTQCGPRFTIVAGLPYDRARTAMATFPMCAACEAEYRNPLDRRFHAQPIACPACGPRLELVVRGGGSLAIGDGALDLAVEALRRGEILALKGLGGFQLLTDATSPAAVGRLRQRKRREAKPFAVMFPSVEAVAGACELSPAERRALCSPEAPIVLVARRTGAGYLAPDLAPDVAPGNPGVGAMLPNTPLHRLLLDAVARPLVCTSGNLSGEPICVETAEAVARLGGIADLFLTHDRPVLRPVDDSVARIGPAGLEILRRARGYAPLPLVLAADGPVTLALGAHLKATIALASGREATLSQHLGDLGSPAAIRLLERTVDDLMAFHGARPGLVACDLHPDYASTRLAESLAARWQVPLVRVQHHHAHAAAVVAEHGLVGEILALTWDGAGYGPDGTIWGGEALLLADSGYRRVASLRPFRLPGGDAAAREPRRSLIGLLAGLSANLPANLPAGLSADLASGFPAALPQFVQRAPEVPWVELERRLSQWFDPDEAATLRKALGQGVNSPATTSMGRLFDAVSALVGLCGRQTFEGEAAMALEFAADAADPGLVAEPYPLPLVLPEWVSEVSPGSGRPGTPAEPGGTPESRADWAPLLREAALDLTRGASAGHVAARFHASLAHLAVAIARTAGMRQVVLAGGCFQNLRLARLVRRHLEAAQFQVFSPLAIPPNDGGIALGQIQVARSH